MNTVISSPQHIAFAPSASLAALDGLTKGRHVTTNAAGDGLSYLLLTIGSDDAGKQLPTVSGRISPRRGRKSHGKRAVRAASRKRRGYTNWSDLDVDER